MQGSADLDMTSSIVPSLSVVAFLKGICCKMGCAVRNSVWHALSWKKD